MPKRLAMKEPWAGGESLASNATRVLPAMTREYFAAGRKIVASKPDAGELHPFRLKTKQIRYTLEGFLECYGDSVAGLLEKLKPVQDALGDVNDAVATRAEFDLGKKFDGFLKRRAKEKARKFFKAWKNEFDLPGEEDAWIGALSSISKPS